MKRILTLISTVCMMVLSHTSCQRIYNSSYPEIRYDYTSYKVDFTSRSLPFTVYYDGEWSLSFSDPWATFDISQGQGITTVHIIIEENGSESREGTITVKALSGGSQPAQITLFQGACPAFRSEKVLNADEFFERIPENGKNYISSDESIDFLEGRVSGFNDNSDQNVESSQILITSAENDCTCYLSIQDASGAPRGVRLKFDRAEYNNLAMGTAVRIPLDGLKVMISEEPFGVTLSNLLASDVKILENSDLPEYKPYTKTLSTLDATDLYNYVTITGLEFSVREGSFTNVREFDAIECWSNSMIPVGSTTTKPARRVKDGAATMLYDADGKAIYMIINMKCDWRRSGKVPQGIGSVSGIIVHANMPRYGKDGNVGRWSIRPLGRDDIKVAEAKASAWKTLAEWVLTEETNYLSTYRWNRSATPGGYILGLDTETTPRPDFVSNSLCATSEATGANAILYSENLKQYLGWDKNLSKKPVNTAHGYRSIDVSDPGSPLKADPSFDQSKYSALTFAGSPEGFYEWDASGEWTGKTKGIVAEFSSQGVTGTAAAVSFSIAAGAMSTDVLGGNWKTCSSWPAFWKVEYRTKATSTDSWSDYVTLHNAIEGAPVDVFEMKSIPWALGASPWGRPISPYSQPATGGLWTGLDWGFGFVRHRFVLPSDALGKALVQVRITPTSTVLATLNLGGTSTACMNQMQTDANVNIRSTMTYDVRPQIYIEDFQIEYR